VLRAQFAAAPYDASQLTMGYEYSGEHVESQRVPGGAKAYFNNVLYGEDEWTMGRATLSVGARWSHNSVYGSFLAPRASLVFMADEHFTLRGSYGRGFRAPSIKELYIDFANTGVGYMVEGNPLLVAEKSHGANIGLSYTRGDLVWFRLNGYYNALNNLIDYYLKSSNPNVLSYRNIDDAITTGLDVDVDVQPVSSLMLSGGYAFTLAQDGDGHKLPFRTPNMVNLKAAWTWSVTALRTTLRARWNDRQLVTDEETNLAVHEQGVPSVHFYTPAYWVFDAMVDMPVFTHFRASAGVNNVFDYTYYPFGQIKPREYFAGLSFAWQ
jgi:outer membrane receptor for ferrienterochelin and colicins